MSQPTPPVPEEEPAGLFARWNKSSIFERTAIVLVGIIALFVLALILSIIIGLLTGDSEDVAAIVTIIRDLFIILLAMQGMVMALALVILILQLATLINLLQNEINPITRNLQDVSETLKGTSEFLSDNVTAPVIESKAVFSGLSTFFREVRGLRKAIRPNHQPSPGPGDLPLPHINLRGQEHDGNSSTGEG